MMRFAWAWCSDVYDLVNPQRKCKVEMMRLTANQTHHLLETVATDRLEALYVVAITTGIREANSLRLSGAASI
jgi:hypothetical protein